MACGSVGALIDSSTEVEAHSSNNLRAVDSKVLRMSAELSVDVNVGYYSGSHLVLRRTNTTTSEKVYNRRGYTFRTAHSLF